jgi:DNA-binding transcriptional MerR regulator
MGLTLDQIREVLEIWNGVNCAATHDEIRRLIEAKRVEVLERAAELERFAEQLDAIRVAMEHDPPPAACVPDLSCCVPEGGPMTVEVTLSDVPGTR